MSVKITLRQCGDVTIIDSAGRITLGDGAGTLRDTIKNFVKQGKTKTILNLADTSYVDSSGMGEIVSGFTVIANMGGHLKLLALTKRIEDFLQITKLYTVFEVFEDEGEAIRSLDC